MTDRYTLYGTEFSLYSGKARSYLRYKRAPFDEVLSSLSVYKRIIIPNTGVRFVPVVRTPDGQYLQDTSNIIDSLEAAIPGRPVLPSGPRQRLASLLLELYGDEWLLIPAMHYRWNHPNFPFIYDEFGRTLLPRWPAFMQRIAGKRVAARFRGFLPILGISPDTASAIEDWYENTVLATLERHFSNHDFLFGGSPTIGDFGLIGPLYAHLYRDPSPGKLMRERAPQVAAWVARMIRGDGESNALLADDVVPESLTPIFRNLFEQHWPVLTDTARCLGQWAANRDSDREFVPRKIGEHSFHINGARGTRAMLAPSIWKMQRPIDCYNAMTPGERQEADRFLRQVGGLDALQFELPIRLKREDNRFITEHSSIGT